MLKQSLHGLAKALGVGHLVPDINPTNLTREDAEATIARMNQEANDALRNRIIAYFEAHKVPARVEAAIEVRWETQGLQ